MTGFYPFTWAGQKKSYVFGVTLLNFQLPLLDLNQRPSD